MRFVSPASPPERSHVERGAKVLQGWGLTVEIGAHAFDEFGHYLAGRDEDRLADINDALRDPGVRAIFTTTGGKGSYRIAHGLDFEAARRNPKPLIGFSDITTLHLVLWRESRVGGFHGPYVEWNGDYDGAAVESLRRALMEPQELIVRQDPSEFTSAVSVPGTATGVLLGGNLGMIGGSVGWACPSFSGAILFIEAIDMYIGQMDGTLTQLRRSGYLEGMTGVAIGQFIRSAEPKRGKWSAIDVLNQHFGTLGIPVLGGLPVGHGPVPLTIPLGTTASIDTTRRTLTIEPGVR